MKVKCIMNIIDDSLTKNLGLPSDAPRIYTSLMPDSEYVVLGLTYDPNARCYAGYPVLEIKNENSGLSLVPIFLFEILDNSVSKYWKCKYQNNGLISFLPESFYREFYHDDLSEGVPEIVEDFKKVSKLIEKEQQEKA